MALLEVKNLSTYFYTKGGVRKAVDGVSFSMDIGETLGLVGESGSGKTVTALSILRLIDEPGRITGGEVIFEGKPLFKLPSEEMRAIRGKEIAVVFQEPLTALNPVMTVGEQIVEQILAHADIPKSEAKARSLGLLKEVHLPEPERVFYDYPHRLSGGMRQRAMIAIALACNPKLLIADEPTTALDVTIQAQIIDLMKGLQKELNTAIILITHDLGVVADMAQRILVMYAGKIIESGSIEDIFYRPQHPYTWGLLKSVPRLDSKQKEDLMPIEGTPPDLFAPPVGCGFAARCEYCMNICKEKQPEFLQVGEGHHSACWLAHPNAPKVDRLVGMGGVK